MTRIAIVVFAVHSMLAAAFAFAGPANAQENFPTKPVRIVLPVPAGSAPDVLTRVLADQMGRSLGQQVIVENRPGAGGAIAAQTVAAAPADGYTLLLGVSSTWTILPAQKKLPFDVNREFTQVGMIVGSIPIHLAASPRLGVDSYEAFAALARSKPGEIVVGTNGTGTLPHFAALALAKQGNLPITIVPYNHGGTTAAISDIMGGRVHATIEAISGLRGAIQSGDVKLIGVMQDKPDPLFPAVSMIGKSIRFFSMIGFMTLAAPARTPAPVVERLNHALAAALATDVVRRRFDELSFPAETMTPEQASAFVQEQQQRWWPLVKELDPGTN